MAHAKKNGIYFENASIQDTILHNVVSYNNGGAGIYMNGSNNAISNAHIYNNGGKAIDGSGNSNYYYNTLKMFNNAGGNTATMLTQGLASHWRNATPLGNGSISTTGTFASPAFVVRPTNVTGFNPTVRGYQSGLTWPPSVTWSFGTSLPNQTAPLLMTDCSPSASANNRCQLSV